MQDYWIIVFENLKAPRDFRSLGLTCKRGLVFLNLFRSKLVNCRHLERLLRYFPEGNHGWNWYKISSNPNITWKYISENLDKPWDWGEISRNLNITCEIISQNPDNPWNWYALSWRSDITWEFISQNLDKDWYWSGLSQNPNITWEIISSNLDKPWNWNEISYNTFNKKFNNICNL